MITKAQSLIHYQAVLRQAQAESLRGTLLDIARTPQEVGDADWQEVLKSDPAYSRWVEQTDSTEGK